MHTALIASSANKSRQVSYTRGMSNWSATRRLDSRLRLTTPMSSTPLTLRKPGMWRLRTFPPAPIRPTRMSASAMSNLLHERLSQGQLDADLGVLPQQPHRSERRARCEIVLDDLAPGCAPHPLVAQDVRKRRVERADPVRHADDERVQTDRHDTSRLRALAVERVELAADHQFEFVRRPAGADDLGQIVDLGRVWD